VPFSSPWRTIYFDRVTRAVPIRAATVTERPVRRGEPLPHGRGSDVEAAIPWRVLGFQPQPGLKLRGDFGVLCADSGGTATIARHYWSSQATGLVNDVPGEADLTPSLWGELQLD